jgi:hypothetical protein
MFIFSFRKWNVCEHGLGKSAAKIPNMQIILKIKPTNGLRQKRSSWMVGGLDANSSTMNIPKMEMLMFNIRMESKRILGM